MTYRVTDSQIAQIRSGNSEIWRIVEEDFEPGLRSQAKRLVRTNELTQISAEDLVQETWFKAWNARGSFRGTTITEFIKWLLVILKNTYIDKCRKKSHFELTVPTRFENTIGHENTPSENVRMAEKDNHVSTMLGSLDKMSRRIIDLKNDGLKFHEIAKMLGMNPNTVASIYRRSIQKLKQSLISLDGSWSGYT